jgi:small-conductance mechanosensitive channel
MTVCATRRLLAAAILVWTCAFAFLPIVSAPTKAAEVAVSTEVKDIRAKLEAIRANLDQKEAALERRDLPDRDLQALRQEVEPFASQIREMIAALAPKVDSARARLEQLGPKKDDQPESEDAARERTERQAAFAEYDETQRLAKTLLVQAEQLSVQVGDRRRSLFTRALFQQSAGLAGPSLWSDVIDALPRELYAAQTVLGDTVAWLQRHSSPGALLAVGLALGIAIALYIGRSSLGPRLIRRDPAVEDPGRNRRLMAALGVLLIGAGPAVAGSWIIWAALDAVDLLPPRIEPVAQMILRALAWLAFVRALADAVLAPGRGAWRLVSVNDSTAHRLVAFAIAFVGLVLIGKVVDSVNEAIAASLPITVATRGIFAIGAALVLAAVLRSCAGSASAAESSPSTRSIGQAELGGPLRIVGWTLVTFVLGSALFGYVAFASFLIEQAIWLSILLTVLFFLIALVDEFIGGSLRGQTRLVRTIQANTGLRQRSLEQIGILVSGILHVVLIVLALMAILAPWGIESTDLLSSVRAAFFGFQVGDVTISISSIVVALLLFGIGFGVTRVVQRWLDSTFLPATDLDAGLRNSIRTVFGYVGVIIAGTVSFSYLGLSLDRIAIVAGALSVGIGFGLQSIVNNFVSGLILLWERPIRVGDLVVVGDGEGHVRRINVRATEIETFDRSVVMVPNSNLISGIVRNRVRNDRIGRVNVMMPVPRLSDPDETARIMRDCALAHREVMSEPSARVLFKRITDTALEFDLVCFVDDVEVSARVSSDLMFACHRALREAGIMPSPPVPDDEAAGEEPKPEAPSANPGQPPAEAATARAETDSIPKPTTSAGKEEQPPPPRKEPARQPARTSRVKVPS